ncbi:transcriptional corepressor LEUNIG_HOMOLOG-like [Euphorbia lathyris]|uniref:transcriptional corepressor LEUNIG_HOMOLOG-like n=1 Tax=Euphorbia lathyris TaxID=212925 RepID=UPI0033142960
MDGGGADQWDARKMFDLYLHDYFVKKKMHRTAAAFRKEASVSTKPVAIDTCDGFLLEWWTLFHDRFQNELQQQEAKEKSSDKDELHNICNTVPQLAINHDHMPEPFPFYPEYMSLGQPMPFFLPNPSSQQQQNCNQSQQLVVRQTTVVNSTSGPNSVGFNHLRVQRGVNEVINPFPPHVWILNSTMPAPNRPQQFPRLKKEQSQQNLLGGSIRLTYGNRKSTCPSSSGNFHRQKPMLPKSNLSQKEAQVVQMKQTEEHHGQNYQNLQQQLTNNSKQGRLVHSVAGENTLGHENAEVESFLSATVNDDKEGNPLGFTFQEIGCLQPSKSKVLCCHFSSDGRLLASAGHEKKVCTWDMNTYDFTYLSEGHSLLITDVRFKPNSTILATSSFDRTLQIWDAAKPNKSLLKLHGHADQVMALDFHPRKVDLLCSCGIDDEIRLWNVNRRACLHVSKGATKQVRFQPQTGNLLAAATGNNINVIDTEIRNRVVFNLKGHVKEVLCLCWHMNGKYIASVSEDSARVWSLESGGSCIHELLSNGNKFQSCTFHPGHSLLLIIGCYQSIELWNPIENSRTWSVAAHNGLIAAVADSVPNQMIASASHDRCVKIWK